MQAVDAAAEIVFAGHTAQKAEPGMSATNPWRQGRQKEMLAFPSVREKKPAGHGRNRVLLAFA